MKELINYWSRYITYCEQMYAKEQERANSVNEENRKNGLPGFEFPKKTFDNQPSWEGFIDWLKNNI